MKRCLLETVRVRQGRVPLWPRHLARLERSCRELQITMPELIEPRGGADRVLRFEIQSTGVRVTERPVEELAGISLVCAPAVHRGYRHKIDDRAWLDAARSGVTPLGGDDAVMLDREGLVVEATRWAVGWWESEALCFPPLVLGGLPSVGRERLAELARGGIHERELRGEELFSRSLLVCNAARGVVAVVSIDGVPSLGNHRTEALGARFWPE